MSTLPGNWLAACMADLKHDLQVLLSWGSTVVSFHSPQSFCISFFHVSFGLTLILKNIQKYHQNVQDILSGLICVQAVCKGLISTGEWECSGSVGRVLDSRQRGRRFEPHRRHCVVVLEQDAFILAQYWFNPGRFVPV